MKITTRGTPPYCLTFLPQSDSSAPTIKVNIKPLKCGDLTRLAIFLPKIAPDVEYNRRFLLMAEGKMPSMFSSNY